MPSPDLIEAIAEAERLYAAAPDGNWSAKDWSVFTDGTDCVVVAYTATNYHRRTPKHKATCDFIAASHSLLPRLIAAYRAQAQTLARVQAAAAKLQSESGASLRR